MKWALAAFAVMSILPGASALDAFPTETHWGTREATFVARTDAGPLRVHAPPGVNVTTIERDWHGLAGAEAMRATRPDGAAAGIEITDARGTGVLLEWPAEVNSAAPPDHHVAAPGWLPAAALSAAACGLARRRVPR